ncbi:MAG TPA: hypothetical protein VM657_11945 [Sphingomonas sp.]|nr:hypothetical protein [Sphingomonas sp.]
MTYGNVAARPDRSGKWIARRGLSMVALPLMLAGCGGSDPGNVSNVGAPLNAIDINAAAIEAQGDIDTYAANSLENQPTPMPSPVPTPAPSPVATPPAPGEPGGLPDDRTPVSEAPFTPESAQGAANVVQTYYALIEQGKYREAWQLWSDGGKASGTTADAFAARFDKYKEYHANIGAPGRVDAGAGQRYVEVPVQVYGTLKDGGRPFNARGSITLHRTADIPGATAEDKSWHISKSDVSPPR